MTTETKTKEKETVPAPPGSGHMIAEYVRAGYPAVAIESYEEGRVLDEMVALTKQHKMFSKFKIFTISANKQLIQCAAAVPGKPEETKVIDNGVDFAKAFAAIAGQKDSLLVVFDFQHIINNAGSYRALKDQFGALKLNGSLIVLAAPTWKLPAELQHDVQVLDFALPSREQLNSALDVVIDSLPDELQSITAAQRSACLDSASGLTLAEAENAFALSTIRTRRLDPATIAGEKMRLIRSSGLLELAPPPPVQPGGLGELKAYFREEVIPVKDDAMLQCRGIIGVGIQGGGKSLMSKWMGYEMGWPVLKMNIGALKAGIVGQSESQMRRALKLADAVAPCVLWVDEIEKGVGGHASSAQSDGGVTLGMIGIWLEWLQEHTTSVFTVATCNDFSKLPAELTRAGRFDERFFVDLPNALERPEIALAHLARYCAASVTESQMMDLAALITDLTEGWTGAEIEQLIKSGARRTKRAITAESLELSATTIRPISKVKEGEINQLREWASTALRPANTAMSNVVAGPKRRIR